jgi:hypothetical protein
MEDRGVNVQLFIIGEGLEGQMVNPSPSMNGKFSSPVIIVMLTCKRKSAKHLSGCGWCTEYLSCPPTLRVQTLYAFATSPD